MTDDYYDGATDALAEAQSEIKAAWILTPIKREHFTTDSEFWREVAIEAVQALRDSYGSDKKFMREYRAKREASA